MQFNYFLGIDTSKAKLDLCIYDGKQIIVELEIKKGFSILSKLFKQLKEIKPDICVANTLICVEHTGVYTNGSYKRI